MPIDVEFNSFIVRKRQRQYLVTEFGAAFDIKNILL